MAKQKLKRFAEINAFPNVIQPEIRHPASHTPLRGTWNQEYFMNDNPVLLEVGCGKGEYSLALARSHPDLNIIGIDIKGDRLWKGATAALDEGLMNVAFLRIQAERISMVFNPGEISGIWITFPDPQLRESRRKKRLTSPRFLARYREILKPGSPIHLKTDNAHLFEYTLDVINQEKHELHLLSHDLYAEAHGNKVLQQEPLLTRVQTHYEKQFLSQGMPIHYLKFSLKNPDGQKNTHSHA